MGQCNDAYPPSSWRWRSAEAFECGVNDLPLTLVLSWFEQKAIVILLTLLALGVKDIRTGPTAPAFLTPALLKVLEEQFGLKGTTTADADPPRSWRPEPEDTALHAQHVVAFGEPDGSPFSTLFPEQEEPGDDLHPLSLAA